MKSALYRLWRIPLKHALWLALPLQIVMFWVAHRGWVQYQRNHDYSSQWGVSPPLDVEQWRYFAQRELKRSLHRTFAPQPVSDGLDTIKLSVDRAHVGSLNSDLPRSGRSRTYPATLEVNGEAWQVKTRYMGDNHWHWLYPQKSWRIKSRKGDPIFDRRSFNLKNPPTVVGLEDIIANELAAEVGLISPEIRPVKLFVNGAYSGLYLWWDLADESLLRRAQRMPGSIYSGDGAPPGADGVSSLFRSESRWEKSGARNAEQAADRSDIQALIRSINEFDGLEFYAFANEFIDVAQYAKFVALDRLMGGQHHDYCHNNKLYFDPYKGRWEPIEWDFAFWVMGPRFPGIDQTLNPLLERVREQPEFELAIQEALYGLMQSMPPARMHERIDTGVETARKALASDGFRDARDHTGSGALRLAAVHSAYFGDETFATHLKWMKGGYERRWQWLSEQLAAADLEVAFAGVDGGVSALTLRSASLTGQRLQQVDVTTNASVVEIYRDRNGSGSIDAGERLAARADVVDGKATLALDDLVLPGARRKPHRFNNVMNNGLYVLEPAPLLYGYLLKSPGGSIQSVQVVASNAVTGDAVTPRQVDAVVASDDVVSCHPWKHPLEPAPRTVSFGPGEVRVVESVVFGPECTVVIQPGTTLLMGKDVSVEIRGQVQAVGTEAEPIRFQPAVAGEPWGVFALHGLGTSGSRFAHCQWRDGSTARLRMVWRTGMVSIIETSDIEMQHCFIGRNFVGDDALHWGYIEGGLIRDCEFRGARSDALDVDISHDVRLLRCAFYESGNDSVDLMTSHAEIVDCRFLDAGDKGVSVGEGSRLDLTNSQFDNCVIGIEIKDGSVATVDAKSAMRRCATGVNLYRKNPRYSKGGTLHADSLTVIGSAEAIKHDKRSTIHVGTLHTEESKD